MSENSLASTRVSARLPAAKKFVDCATEGKEREIPQRETAVYFAAGAGGFQSQYTGQSCTVSFF